MMLWTFAFVTGFCLFAPQQAGTLKVVVRNIEANEGHLFLALYREEASWLHDEGRFRKKVIGLESEPSGEIEFVNLPFGIYGLAIFHDLNGNEVLDTNWLGVPVEPYSFSGIPASRWRKPHFEEASFSFRESGQEVRVVLKRWKDK